MGVSGNGTVTSGTGGINCGNSCDGSFNSGSQVTLQATPAAAYVFTSWSGSCSGSAASCTVTMNQDQSISAIFSAQSGGVAVVSGKLVLARTNTPFIPRGFTSIGIVYPAPYAATLCSSTLEASNKAANMQQARAAITAAPLPGLAYNASFQAMVQDWHVNSVRFQVSEGALD